MTLNLPLLYVLWLEEYCQISPNKNKSPNLWHVTSILVSYIFGSTYWLLHVNNQYNRHTQSTHLLGKYKKLWNAGMIQYGQSEVPKESFLPGGVYCIPTNQYSLFLAKKTLRVSRFCPFLALYFLLHNFCKSCAAVTTTTRSHSRFEIQVWQWN